MLRFLLGAIVGFVIAAIVLPEDVRLRESLYEGWVATRVFVAELMSGLDQAAEQAIEATEQASEEVERAIPDDADEAARDAAPATPAEPASPPAQ